MEATDATYQTPLTTTENTMTTTTKTTAANNTTLISLFTLCGGTDNEAVTTAEVAADMGVANSAATKRLASLIKLGFAARAGRGKFTQTQDGFAIAEVLAADAAAAAVVDAPAFVEAIAHEVLTGQAIDLDADDVNGDAVTACAKCGEEVVLTAATIQAGPPYHCDSCTSGNAVSSYLDATSTRTRRAPKAASKTVIASLADGETLEITATYKGATYQGSLLNTGAVVMGDTTHRSCSAAAVAIAAAQGVDTRFNGWKFWTVEGTGEAISTLRA